MPKCPMRSATARPRPAVALAAQHAATESIQVITVRCIGGNKEVARRIEFGGKNFCSLHCIEPFHTYTQPVYAVNAVVIFSGPVAVGLAIASSLHE